jgi:hypothetical protein
MFRPNVSVTAGAALHIFPTMSDVLSLESRLATLGGTRRMIADDQFSMLVNLLVECGVIRAEVMTAALRKLASDLRRKAQDDYSGEWEIDPSEVYDRARGIDRLVDRLAAAPSALSAPTETECCIASRSAPRSDKEH